MGRQQQRGRKSKPSSTSKQSSSTPSSKSRTNSYGGTSEDEHGARKEDLLVEALKTNNYDELNLLSLSDGGLLIDNHLRSQTWSTFLSISPTLEVKEEKPLSNGISRQIELDVARSYGTTLRGAADKRTKLRKFLNRFFRRNPDLHYYQGFHDVCIVILEVFENVDEGMSIAETLSRNFIFKDSHDPNFAQVEALLKLCNELINKIDVQCAEVLTKTPPFWGVSMLLTCFSHDVTNMNAKLRIFDAVLVSPPIFPIYLVSSLALLPQNRLKLCSAENSNNPHEILRDAARHINSVKQADLLVRTARDMMDKVYPYELLYLGETRCGLTRSSFLFQKFKYDDTWNPPPYVKVNVKNPQNLFFIPNNIGKLNFAQQLKPLFLLFKKPYHYWIAALFIAILSSSWLFKGKLSEVIFGG